MRILLLTLSLLFTQELEVQGDLKVSGNIDAQNNPVKNVGTPQSLTDAINGNVLQDALRDDGPFEYKMYMTRIYNINDINMIAWYEYIEGSVPSNASSSWNVNFHDEVFSLLNSGYMIDETISLDISDSYFKQIWIFRRPIEE